MEFSRVSPNNVLMEKCGSVHGRFQPLHNEHLEYLLEAKKHCNYLWIGITQFNIRNLSESPEGKHRELPFNNPFSYFERVEMITNALVNENIPLSDFGLIPFPIETPKILPDFLPTSIPVYTTICEEWNLYKISMLTSMGYKIVVLWERKEKSIEGKDIRLGIARGDNGWEYAVPEATKQLVKKYNIQSRLQNYYAPNIRDNKF
jgi:cytidyltransferase-like protein